MVHIQESRSLYSVVGGVVVSFENLDYGEVDERQTHWVFAISVFDGLFKAELALCGLIQLS